MVKITRDYLFRNALVFLRVSIGFVYVWFGMLKFFPGLSPAEILAEETIELLMFDLVEGHVMILILAGWEVLLGIALIINFNMKKVIPLMLLHMLCTIVPVFIDSDTVFTSIPFGLTLVGQYIVKNAVFVTAALLILKNSGVTAIDEEDKILL